MKALQWSKPDLQAALHPHMSVIAILLDQIVQLINCNDSVVQGPSGRLVKAS